jgi:hypothetical protein
MSNLLDWVEAALAPLCCKVSYDSIQERRMPMGRLERTSRVKVIYHPEPTVRVLEFHHDQGEPADYRLSGLSRELELIDTPDGPVRGRDITCTVKDGAAVAGVTYVELLHEGAARKPHMGALNLTFTTERS